MTQETITTGRTVAAALDAAAKYFGVPAERITYEILAEPKKGFLGFGEAPAKIKATYTMTSIDLAVNFLRKLVENMGISAEVSVANTDGDGTKFINIAGEQASVLIGHHGETLDQLQYLTTLAATVGEKKEEKDYDRIAVDIEGYRAKREETLRSLARRMANKALKAHHSVSLEPMTAYERRIIHSEVQSIPGVSTNSIGAENNRRVVIFPDKETEE